MLKSKSLSASTHIKKLGHVEAVAFRQATITSIAAPQLLLAALRRIEETRES